MQMSTASRSSFVDQFELIRTGHRTTVRRHTNRRPTRSLERETATPASDFDCGRLL